MRDGPSVASVMSQHPATPGKDRQGRSVGVDYDLGLVSAVSSGHIQGRASWQLYPELPGGCSHRDN